jgi:hypothetical protein
MGLAPNTKIRILNGLENLFSICGIFGFDPPLRFLRELPKSAQFIPLQFQKKFRKLIYQTIKVIENK